MLSFWCCPSPDVRLTSLGMHSSSATWFRRVRNKSTKRRQITKEDDVLSSWILSSLKISRAGDKKGVLEQSSDLVVTPKHCQFFNPNKLVNETWSKIHIIPMKMSRRPEHIVGDLFVWPLIDAEVHDFSFYFDYFVMLKILITKCLHFTSISKNKLKARWFVINTMQKVNLLMNLHGVVFFSNSNSVNCKRTALSIKFAFISTPKIERKFRGDCLLRVLMQA